MGLSIFAFLDAPTTCTVSRFRDGHSPPPPRSVPAPVRICDYLDCGRQRIEDRGRRTEDDASWRTKDEGPRTEDAGRRTKDGQQRTEDGRQRMEDREDGGRRAMDGGWMTDNGWRITDDKIWKRKGGKKDEGRRMEIKMDKIKKKIRKWRTKDETWKTENGN